MTTISSVAKVGYIYNESTSTWHPIAGSANTSLDYEWSGTHSFANDVTLLDVVNAKAGINNFQNPSARDAAIPSPIAGIVCFVRQDAAGNIINQIQYYSSTQSRWVSAYDVQISAKVATHTLTLADSGKMITITSSSDTFLDVPTNSGVALPVGTRVEIVRAGTGEVSIREGSGVTIRSKNSNKRISLQYCGASLTKIATDEWLLFGDLKA
jgi:hypothetical protein